MESLPAWLLNRKKNLGTEIIELKPIRTWFRGWHDVYVKYRWDSIDYVGRAQDPSLRLATLKACSEAIERLGVQLFTSRSGRTSSGFAAHTNFKLAKKNAMLELIERDQFMCHMLTHRSFWDISNQSSSSIFKTTKKKMQALGIELKLGLLNEGRMNSTVICAAFGNAYKNPFGTVLGLACKGNRLAATDKATTECWVGLIEILYGLNDKPISRNQFEKLETVKIEDHIRLGRHPSSGKVMNAFFHEKLGMNKTSFDLPELKSSNFKFEAFNNWPKAFEDIPIKLVTCTNENLQQLFFGFPNSKVLNVNRLNQFMSCKSGPVNKIDLKFLHFFG